MWNPVIETVNRKHARMQNSHKISPIKCFDQFYVSFQVPGGRGQLHRKAPSFQRDFLGMVGRIKKKSFGELEQDFQT